MGQMVVAHFKDSSVAKGVSNDFAPQREMFHIQRADEEGTAAVAVADLKALFFVHSYDGDAENRGRDDAERHGLGRKVQVTFKDGETLHGYTSGYSADRPAFFVFPADPTSNNDRVFVINDATAAVEFV